MIGLVSNFASGALIVIALYDYGNAVLFRICEVFNILPDLVSAAFLIDALRRFNLITKGAFTIETWQMVWHVWSFLTIAIGGILFSIATSQTWNNPVWSYTTYLLIVVLVFCCELPFIFIIYRILS